MVDQPTGDEFLFEVMTPLGFAVHVTRIYWNVLVTVKHPAMLGLENEVSETSTAPDEVRQSTKDSEVYLFYKAQGNRRWVCAVAKRDDGEGFLIICYPTDAIKEGVRIWPTRKSMWIASAIR